MDNHLLKAFLDVKNKAAAYRAAEQEATPRMSSDVQLDTWRGKKLHDFALELDAAIENCEKLMKEYQDAWNDFINTCENPPAPTQKLIDLFRSIK